MHDFFERLTPSHSFARLFGVLSIALVFIWFGALNIDGPGRSISANWISGHPLLKTLSSGTKGWIPTALGVLQIVIGIVIALHAVPGRYKHLAYWGITLISIGSLSLLFSNAVWINSLGGFPAIGAGQGLIKYLAIAGVALWLMGSRHANLVMLAGLILVLGWIGAMKFTGPEANGVFPLLTSSPVFNWWAPVYFSKQMASNIIGAIELLTVFLLTGWWWNKKLCQFGLLLSTVTFIVTLSFMVTFKETWLGSFPTLASAGHFLLKDLILLAATIALAAELKFRP